MSGSPEAQRAGTQAHAGTKPADEPANRLSGPLWADVDIDSTVAPLDCTEIVGAPDHLVEVRHQLARWARNAGLAAAAVSDLVLATYEALANAAEHAYAASGGLVDLAAARTTDGRVLVMVSDHGQWRPPPGDPGYRGRGLQMITALSHRMEVRPGPHGTTVRMEWKV